MPTGTEDRAAAKMIRDYDRAGELIRAIAPLARASSVELVLAAVYPILIDCS